MNKMLCVILSALLAVVSVTCACPVYAESAGVLEAIPTLRRWRLNSTALMRFIPMWS